MQRTTVQQDLSEIPGRMDDSEMGYSPLQTQQLHVMVRICSFEDSEGHVRKELRCTFDGQKGGSTVRVFECLPTDPKRFLA